MEAKELMAKDWVYDGSINIQVTPENIFDIYAGNWDEPKPIPLTEEILKANGFCESIEEGTYYFPEYCEAHDRGYALETVAGVWFITEHLLMLFTYVHELQHALRLCDLNDLADNFKV